MNIMCLKRNSVNNYALISRRIECGVVLNYSQRFKFTKPKTIINFNIYIFICFLDYILTFIIFLSSKQMLAIFFLAYVWKPVLGEWAKKLCF